MDYDRAIDMLGKASVAQVEKKIDLDALLNELLSRYKSESYSIDPFLIIKLASFSKGFRWTYDWVENNSNLPSGKKDNIVLRLMGQFNKNKEEEQLLISLIERKGLSLVFFHRMLCVLFRSGRVYEAVGFFVSNSQWLFENNRNEFFFEWAHRLQCWDLFISYEEKIPDTEKGMMYKDLSKYLANGSGFPDSIDPIGLGFYCVSLEKDVGRYRASEILMKGGRSGRELKKIVGVLGSALPDQELERINEKAKIPMSPSIVGCGFSHISAMENFLRSSDQFGVIIEDDATWFRPSEFSFIKSLDFDLVFLNDRNSAGFMGRSIDNELYPAKKEFCKGGCYGYLVSKRGAKKILDLFRRDGLVRHVDGQIIDYCESDEIIGYTLSYPMIGHFDGGYSSRYGVDLSVS